MQIQLHTARELDPRQVRRFKTLDAATSAAGEIGFDARTIGLPRVSQRPPSLLRQGRAGTSQRPARRRLDPSTESTRIISVRTTFPTTATSRISIRIRMCRSGIRTRISRTFITGMRIIGCQGASRQIRLHTTPLLHMSRATKTRAASRPPRLPAYPTTRAIPC